MSHRDMLYTAIAQRMHSANPAVRYWAAGQLAASAHQLRQLSRDADPAIASRARKTWLTQHQIPNHAPAWPECYPEPEVSSAC